MGDLAVGTYKMYGHHPKYRSKITIFSGLRVIVIAILGISRQGVLESIGRAYAFFTDIVRGVSQAFRRYFYGISNPIRFFKIQ